MILECGRQACPEHDDLCAYHGDEPGRCPFCHQTWAACQDTHGCEHKRTWTGKARITKPALARARRLAHATQTHETRDRDAFCTHQPETPTHPATAANHPYRSTQWNQS